MTLENPNWEDIEFELRDYKQTRRLNHNHPSFHKKLNKFSTYNSNLEIPCFSYDIIKRHCINDFGYKTREYLENENCRTAERFLENCINN